jgi:hypothetical protein
MKHPQRDQKNSRVAAIGSFAGCMRPDNQGRVEGGFICPVCEGHRTRVGAAVECHPFPPMAVCRPCYVRAKNDEAFKQRATDRVRASAPVEFARHLADHLQHPIERLVQVFSASACPADWDAALGLPAGSSDAAISCISGSASLRAGAERQTPQRVRDAVLATAHQVAPTLGIPAQQLAESMLNHPDFEQLMAEALVLHQRNHLAARRH